MTMLPETAGGEGIRMSRSCKVRRCRQNEEVNASDDGDRDRPSHLGVRHHCCLPRWWRGHSDTDPRSDPSRCTAHTCSLARYDPARHSSRHTSQDTDDNTSTHTSRNASADTSGNSSCLTCRDTACHTEPSAYSSCYSDAMS